VTDAQAVALLPATHQPSGIRLAPGVRAGRWIFATGLKGTARFDGAIADEVIRADLPDWDAPKVRREADQIFRNLAVVLEAGGSSLRNVVRVDQNYLGPRAVECYHDARRAFLADHIPPSTSTLARRLLFAGQDIEVHAIGVVPQDGWAPLHVRPEGQSVHPSSGYSVAVTVGDHVFVAGRIADSLEFGAGVAPEARLPTGYLWKGTPVKLETEFIVRRKLEPALAAAGSSLRNLVKCQVYLRDPADFAPFNEVWRSFFGPDSPPATTLIPTADPAFTVADLRVEINAIAVRDGGSVPRRVVEAGTMPAYEGHPAAVRAGDLLLLSGLLAIDAGGLVRPARRDPAKPYFGSSVQAQMEAILASAERICAAAGTSLANVVRIQQYHTDLNEFFPAWQVWDRCLPGRHLPLSAVEVPFLPVPGCTVQLELWVYAPLAGGAPVSHPREKA
jgi:enamine deaminase RidA (YjgF/YER057c/UK114 family)